MGIGLAVGMHHGLPLIGRTVSPGRALYVILEGRDGFRKRIAAWEVHHGIEVGSTEFSNARHLDLGELRALQKAEMFDVVIVDTASKTGMIANESQNSDVAPFLAAFHEAVHEFHPSATGIVLHHVTETRDGNGRTYTKARGASAWRDDVDTMVLLTGTKTRIRLTTEDPYGKQKDGIGVTLPNLSLQKSGEAFVIVANEPDEKSDDAQEGGDDEMRTLDAEVVDFQAKTDLAKLRKAFKKQKPTIAEAKVALGVGYDRAKRAHDLWK